MGDGDRLSGFLLLLFGLYYGYETWQLSFGGFRQPDSGFFPSCLALALLGTSMVIVAGSFRAGRVAQRVRFERIGRVVVAVAVLLLYVVVLNPVGYLISTFLVMMLLLRGLERLRWRTSLGIALPAVVLSYFVFRWLGVPLPPGPIPL